MSKFEEILLNYNDIIEEYTTPQLDPKVLDGATGEQIQVALSQIYPNDQNTINQIMQGLVTNVSKQPQGTKPTSTNPTNTTNPTNPTNNTSGTPTTPTTNTSGTQV